MSNVDIPFGLETSMDRLEPADDEVMLYPSQLRVGMVVVAADYIYRKGQYFMRHYCPDEPLHSTRPAEWCQVVEYNITEYPDRTGLMMSMISFVGKHRDGALVNYQFVLLSDTTNFIVKRSSIVDAA